MSEINNLINILKRAKQHIHSYIKLLFFYIKNIFKTLKPKKVFIGLLLVTLIFWLSLHFYFGSQTRINSIFSNNITAIGNTLQIASSIDVTFNNLDLAGDTSVIKQRFESLNSATNGTNLPPKLLVDYAYSKGGDESRRTVNQLYEVNIGALNKTYSSATEGYIELLAITSNMSHNKQLLDTDNIAFEKYLAESVNRLRQIEDSSIIDTSTVQKIYLLISESLLEYRQTKDIEMFNYRYENLYSELVKEFANAWDSSFNENILDTLNILQNLQKELVS